MKKYILITITLLLISGRAAALSPDDASKGVSNLNFCKLLFQDFDISAGKHKNIGVFVYDADKKKVEEKFKYFIEHIKQEFGKEDVNKIMIHGTVDSAMKFYSEADSYTQAEVERFATNCRKILY